MCGSDHTELFIAALSGVAFGITLLGLLLIAIFARCGRIDRVGDG